MTLHIQLPAPAGLSDPDLFRQAMLIDGEWVQADSGRTIEVRNPANGSVIGHVPDAGRQETARAIAAAERALVQWRERLPKERAAILRRLYELMLEHIDDLALVLTLEQGKPLAEARGEILYAAGFIEWFAEEAKRIYGDIIPPNQHGRRILVEKGPIGVFAAITPWNFPSAMITRKTGPGWAAGCTGVIKPATETPFSAFALGVLTERAGLPPGVCNIVTGSAREIGAEVTESQVVRKLTFTGSTEIGALLLEKCAPTIKKTSMELGGNAPFIVFDDAEIEAAVQGALAAKYRNTGQACVAANRILVQSGIYDAFAQRFAEETARLKIGAGTEAGVTLGPLISPEAVAKVEEHISDAVAKGAKVVTGGKRHELGGNFFEPTVLTDVPRDALIFSDETFGPVAPLFRFEDEEGAIRLANDTPFGLAAYFYARDVGRIFRVSRALEFGIIGVNEGFISTEVAPFGGVKASGLGREGSKYGIDDYVEIKYIALGGLAALT